MKQSRFIEQTPKKVHRRFATSKRIKLRSEDASQNKPFKQVLTKFATSKRIKLRSEDAS